MRESKLRSSYQELLDQYGYCVHLSLNDGTSLPKEVE